MSLSREEAERLIERCRIARKYNNDASQAPMPFPNASWVVDAIIFASGGQIDEPCYPGGQLLDDVKPKGE